MKLILSLCQKIAKEASKKVEQLIVVRPLEKAITKTEPPIHRKFREKFIYNVFGKYLLTTNTVTSGLLMVIGDTAAQEIEYRRGENPLRHDWNRTGVMFIVGAMQGPMHHYFYMWIDAAIKTVNLVNVTKKILLDQCIMSPIFITTFFYSAGWLSKQTTQQCNDEMKNKFVKVYMTDWMVWPAAQFINFYYLHPKYRVIYVNFITMLFDVFLSYVKHDHDEIVDQTDKKCIKKE